jgi:orotidine-5'-phosphate decarboxylase
MAEDANDFGARVLRAVRATGPLCAGVDPSTELLARWGLPDDASGLREFTKRCVEAFVDVVPVIKPQVAFFERHGSAGLAVLEELLAAARAAGLLAIADVKRADIATTSAAYADAWLGNDSPLRADAMTAVPYLGVAALSPMVELARANGRGVLMVIRSSNPEGRALQEGFTRDGAMLADSLLDEVATLNRAEGRPVGSVGAIIGATLTPSGFSLPQLKGVIVAPGLGAQGGGAAEVATLFGDCPFGTVLPSTSRSLLAAGPDIRVLRGAASQARDQIAAIWV